MARYLPAPRTPCPARRSRARPPPRSPPPCSRRSRSARPPSGPGLPAPRRRHLDGALRGRAHGGAARRRAPRACTATATTAGIPPLVDALVEKLRARNGLAVERDGVLVTAGATSGLACAVGGARRPGRGGADPGAVLAADPRHRALAARAAGRGAVLRPRATRRPTPWPRSRSASRRAASRSTSRARRTRRAACCRAAWLEALAELARGATTSGSSPTRCTRTTSTAASTSRSRASRPSARSPRSRSRRRTAWRATASAISPGPPRDRRGGRTRSQVHSAYHAPTAAQLAALRALEGGAGVGEAARASRTARRARTRRARSACPPPEGSCSCSSTSRARLDERGLAGLPRGLLRGRACSSRRAPRAARPTASWVRLCYTALPPADAALEGVRRLARRCSGAPRARSAALLLALRDSITTASAGTSSCRPFRAGRAPSRSCRRRPCPRPRAPNTA